MLVRIVSYEPPWRDQPPFLGLYQSYGSSFFLLVLLRGPYNDGKIENTSWKVLTYDFYVRVVDVSEIERVSAANE